MAVVCLSVGCLHARGLRAAFVGDPQVDNETELEYARKSIYRELRGRKDLDLVIVLGDLVNDNPDLISPSVAILDSLPCPWFAVPGNHDFDVYPDKNRRRDLVTWRQVVGYEDTTFVLGKVRFALANNVVYHGRGGYEGRFNDSQMKWLDSLSRVTPKDVQMVLATHIPVSYGRQRDSLASMFAGHREVLWVCGHTHTVARHTVDADGRVEEMIAGATCGSWWRGVKDEYGIPYSLQNCGAPRGYFVTDFSRKGCRHEYSPVGVADECSAYVRTAEEGAECLFVNVFGGHKDGSVRVVAPGLGRVSLTRTSDVACEVRDVISYNNSISRADRKKRKSEFIPLRRMKSPHLWMVELPAGVRLKEVKILYEDQYMSFKRRVRVNNVPFLN